MVSFGQNLDVMVSNWKPWWLVHFHVSGSPSHDLDSVIPFRCSKPLCLVRSLHCRQRKWSCIQQWWKPLCLWYWSSGFLHNLPQFPPNLDLVELNHGTRCFGLWWACFCAMFTSFLELAFANDSAEMKEQIASVFCKSPSLLHSL